MTFSDYMTENHEEWGELSNEKKINVLSTYVVDLESEVERQERKIELLEDWVETLEEFVAVIEEVLSV